MINQVLLIFCDKQSSHPFIKFVEIIQYNSKYNFMYKNLTQSYYIYTVIFHITNIHFIVDSPYIEFLDDVFYIQYFSFHCACSKFTGFFKIREYNSYIRWLLFWISHIMMNHNWKYLFYEKYSSSNCTHSNFIGSLKISSDYNYYSRWLPFPMSRILFLTPEIGYIYFSPILFHIHIEQLSTNILFHKHVR